jgi:hypothetical protein
MIRWLLIGLSLIAGCCAACSAGEVRCGVNTAERRCGEMRLAGTVQLRTVNGSMERTKKFRSGRETGHGKCVVESAEDDYTVTRGTAIESERSIAWLILEAGMGAIHGDGLRSDSFRSDLAEEIAGSQLETRLAVDGQQQPGRTSFLAAWRLLGFILWDAPGSVERVTTGAYRGHAVRIIDGASNGRVWVRVSVGPPLGDPRVKRARLTLEATDGLADLHWRSLGAVGGGTRIRLSCSADLDIPNCRIIRRIAERQAGPELSGRVTRLRSAGERAARAGRERLTDSVVAEFLREVCR